MHADALLHRRVLVIEDHAELRSNITEGLEAAGCTVFTAATGNDGLVALLLHFPDLVILDLDLPDLSGATILRIIRAHLANEHLPVIVASGMEDHDLSAEIRAWGADNYLRKPFSLHELIPLISRRLLLAAQAWRPSAANADAVVVAADKLDAASRRIDAVAQSTDADFLLEVMHWLDLHHAGSTTRIDTAALDLGTSVVLLRLRLRQLTGRSFTSLLTASRLHRARQLILRGAPRVDDAARHAGFQNFSRFIELFHQHYGITPKQLIQHCRRLDAAVLK